MLSLDGLHVEVDGAGFGIAADCSIARVGKRAGLAVTETGDVVFITAEILLFGCSSGRCDVSYALGRRTKGAILELERAELLIDNLPDNFIRGHFEVKGV